MPHPDRPYRVEKKRENITMSISHASPPNPKNNLGEDRGGIGICVLTLGGPRRGS